MFRGVEDGGWLRLGSIVRLASRWPHFHALADRLWPDQKRRTELGSRLSVDGVENVYKAASQWVDRALRTDDSLFTPGVEIWSNRWLRELRERFLDRPDEGTGTFYDKLRAQLAGSPPEVYQLMAEVLYAHFLMIWKTGMRGETKKNRTDQILGWGAPVTSVPDDLVPGLSPGIANFGQHRVRGLPYYVGFLAEFAEQFKDQPPTDRQRMLADPWALKDFASRIEFRGEMFRDAPYSHWPQYEGLLHLVHPDTFEGTVSFPQKEEFANAKAFARFVTEETEDVDRKLAQIRQGLEAELGRDFDFYDADIGARLDNKNLWDDFVRRAQAYVDTGRLEVEETEYKVDIGRRLAAAREAVLGDSDHWADMYKRGLVGNLIYSVSQARHREWVDKFPEEASRALKAIWSHDDSSVSKRIEAFTDLLPTSVTSGPGSRTTIASVLLMV